MTIKETQELLEAWEHKHPKLCNNELIYTVQLTESVKQLVQTLANKQSEESPNSDSIHHNLSKELSDIMWSVVVLANQSNIDLTSAIIDNLEYRNSKD